MQTWRKAYGALKDSTKVGLAKINSEFKDIDVAIVKATSHVECPPKERHVRKIFAATSSGRPGADASYCVHKLARRLAKTRNWTVALKTLIVFHRILRDGSLTFREELLNYADRGHIFHLSNFADYSSPLAWECSAWVRTYALFLEERLECLRILKFDVEAEQMIKSSLGSAKGHSRMRELPRDELLEQLPALQQLLFRLVGCQPDVAAFRNYLIQYSLALVLKESFKIYCAINDGIINLVDMFFEMSRDDAMRAFNIYKRAGLQAENLSGFYEFCKGLEISRNFQFPSLKQPPPSFLMTMEEYIKEAARGSPERALVVVHREGLETATSAEVKVAPAGEKDGGAARAPAPATIGDLLGLEEISPAATQLEDSNALALAVISPPEIDNKPTSVVGGYDGAVYGWELALVSAPSCINSSLTNGKLAGGFDRHLLDSLYDEAAALQHRNFVAGVQPGLNPFALPLAVAPPLTPPMPSTPPSNPFLDPFFPAVAAVPPPQSTPSLL